MKEYRLFAQSVYDEAAVLETYGIMLCEDNQIVRIIPDISVDREKVGSLVSDFNRYGLEPEHLDQAIEDFLYDLSV